MCTNYTQKFLVMLGWSLGRDRTNTSDITSERSKFSYIVNFCIYLL